MVLIETLNQPRWNLYYCNQRIDKSKIAMDKRSSYKTAFIEMLEWFEDVWIMHKNALEEISDRAVHLFQYSLDAFIFQCFSGSDTIKTKKIKNKTYEGLLAS